MQFLIIISLIIVHAQCQYYYTYQCGIMTCCFDDKNGNCLSIFDYDMCSINLPEYKYCKKPQYCCDKGCCDFEKAKSILVLFIIIFVVVTVLLIIYACFLRRRYTILYLLHQVGSQSRQVQTPEQLPVTVVHSVRSQVIQQQAPVQQREVIYAVKRDDDVLPLPLQFND